MTEEVNNKWSTQNNPLMLEMEKVRLRALLRACSAAELRFKPRHS